MFDSINDNVKRLARREAGSERRVWGGKEYRELCLGLEIEGRRKSFRQASANSSDRSHVDINDREKWGGRNKDGGRSWHSDTCGRFLWLHYSWYLFREQVRQSTRAREIEEENEPSVVTLVAVVAVVGVVVAVAIAAPVAAVVVDVAVAVPDNGDGAWSGTGRIAGTDSVMSSA